MNAANKKVRKKLHINVINIQTKINKFFFPAPFNYSLKKMPTNSWFSFASNSFLHRTYHCDPKATPLQVTNNFTFNQSYHKPNKSFFIRKPTPSYYTSTVVQFIPTQTQINILNNWFECYRIMKNITLIHFNKLIYDKHKINTNFRTTRRLLNDHTNFINEKILILNINCLYIPLIVLSKMSVPI